MIGKEFVLPRTVRLEEGATGSYGRFVVEPFERGYGTTVGNSLRRVLLASLEGAAVTAIRIEGVQHEFSAIPGVKEDVTDIVLNFKQAQLRLNRAEPLIFSFTHKGKSEVTAGDVFKDTEVDVFNPELVLFTATSPTAVVEMEIKVARGRGYVTADHFELEHAPIGSVYLDANFSPVTKVNFLVEDARVGQMTDYDRLVLDVWTNGSLTPEEALQEAARLLMDHLQIFTLQTESADELGLGASGAEDPELIRKLMRSVDELELSVRAANCLKAANIRTIGDLIARQESEMLHFPNFGKKSLDEIKALLESFDLHFGMQVPGYVASTPNLLAAIDDDAYEDGLELDEETDEEE